MEATKGFIPSSSETKEPAAAAPVKTLDSVTLVLAALSGNPFESSVSLSSRSSRSGISAASEGDAPSGTKRRATISTDRLSEDPAKRKLSVGDRIMATFGFHKGGRKTGEKPFDPVTQTTAGLFHSAPKAEPKSPRKTSHEKRTKVESQTVDGAFFHKRKSPDLSDAGKTKSPERLRKSRDSMTREAITREHVLEDSFLRNWTGLDMSFATFVQLCSRHSFQSQVLKRSACLDTIDQLDVQIIAKPEDELLKDSLRKEKQELTQLDQSINELVGRKEFREKARNHLKEGTKPVTGEKDYEEVLIEMARAALSLTEAERLPGTSGGVYLIYNLPKDNPDRKPLFLFKPFDEAPGMPDNPSPDPIVEGRIWNPGRVGFPIKQAALREYALGCLGVKPARVLAKLQLSSHKTKVGVLIDYIPHLMTFRQACDYAQTVARGEADVDALKLTEAQKEMVRACQGWGKLEDLKTEMPLWKKLSSPNVHQIVFESFAYPDLDRNTGNYLLLESAIKGEYEAVSVDADQSFPDTFLLWENLAHEINLPAWVGSPAFDFVMRDVPFLVQSIQSLNIKTIMKRLKDCGILFQEKGMVIQNPVTKETWSVGGDLFAILHAFHTIAKVGLINGNTPNEVARLLFNRDILLNLFKRKKKAEEDDDILYESEAYQRMFYDKLYEDCFPGDIYRDEDEKQFWEVFRAIILEKLPTKKERKK